MRAGVRAVSRVDTRRPQSNQLMMRGMVQVQELSGDVTTNLVEVCDGDDLAPGATVIGDKGIYHASRASIQALLTMCLDVALEGECDVEKPVEDVEDGQKVVGIWPEGG